jgi:hypothetical protein
MRMRGSMAKSRSASASASGEVVFSIDRRYFRRALGYGDTRQPPSLARASTAIKRTSSRARRLAMNCSKSVSTATGSVHACSSALRV